MTDFTRRYFLKLAGSTLCAAAALPFADLSRLSVAKVVAAPPDENGLPGHLAHRLEDAPPASLGRIATWSIDVRAEANRQSKLVRRASRDDVLLLYEQVVGEAVTSYNDIWYQTDGGYVHSMWVQPVENILNPVDLAQNNFWSEVMVPFSDSRRAPNSDMRRYMRVYYTCVFRVIEVVMGKDDQPWYRLQDGITWSPGPYVPAAHLRRIDPSELMPLSPGARKRIEVDLQAQDYHGLRKRCPRIDFTCGQWLWREPHSRWHTPRLVEIHYLAHDRRGRQRLLRPPGCAVPDVFQSASGGDPWRVLTQRLRPSAQSRLLKCADTGGPLVLALD